MPHDELPAPADDTFSSTDQPPEPFPWCSIPNSVTLSLDAINSVAEARHIADRAWFLSNPAVWPERQQQVVAVFDRTILGQGPDFSTAYEAAQRLCADQSKPCPDQYDLTFVIVPDVVDPEPAADWDSLASATT